MVGAIDILLLFFLQAKLSETDMPRWALGFALLFMESFTFSTIMIVLFDSFPTKTFMKEWFWFCPLWRRKGLGCIQHIKDTLRPVRTAKV